MTNSALPELNNPLLKLLNAVSPEFQQGRMRRQEFEQGSRLKDLQLQEREFGLQQSKQQAAQQQEQAQKLQLQQQAKAASEQEVEQVRIGGQLAETLKQIPDIQQRQRVLEQSLPLLQSKGFDNEDIQALFDPDPQAWEQKLDDAILGSKAFTEAREQVLKAGESIVRDGQIQLTVPFKPEKPSKIESQLLAEGFQVGTPEAQARAREIGDKAGVNVNVGQSSFKVPTGFMMADAQDPSKGVVFIPGGPADRQSPEAAAKTQMLESAQSSVNEFKNGLTAEDGSIDRVKLTQIATNLPFTEGRQLKVLILDAIEAKLRAESGAAVPEDEVKRAAKRFMPSLADDDSTINRKLDLLSEFIKGAFEKIRPESKLPSSDEDMDPSLLEFMTPEERALFNGS